MPPSPPSLDDRGKAGARPQPTYRGRHLSLPHTPTPSQRVQDADLHTCHFLDTFCFCTPVPSHPSLIIPPGRGRGRRTTPDISPPALYTLLHICAPFCACPPLVHLLTARDLLQTSTCTLPLCIHFLPPPFLLPSSQLHFSLPPTTPLNNQFLLLLLTTILASAQAYRHRFGRARTTLGWHLPHAWVPFSRASSTAAHRRGWHYIPPCTTPLLLTAATPSHTAATPPPPPPGPAQACAMGWTFCLHRWTHYFRRARFSTHTLHLALPPHICLPPCPPDLMPLPHGVKRFLPSLTSLAFVCELSEQWFSLTPYPPAPHTLPRTPSPFSCRHQPSAILALPHLFHCSFQQLPWFICKSSFITTAPSSPWF